MTSSRPPVRTLHPFSCASVSFAISVIRGDATSTVRWRYQRIARIVRVIHASQSLLLPIGSAVSSPCVARKSAKHLLISITLFSVRPTKNPCVRHQTVYTKGEGSTRSVMASTNEQGSTSCAVTAMPSESSRRIGGSTTSARQSDTRMYVPSITQLEMADSGAAGYSGVDRAQHAIASVERAFRQWRRSTGRE